MDTYEKKYKEIVGLIKKAYLYAQTDSTKAVLEEIFPELKESEDERIKEAIIATIHLYYGEPLDDEAKEMIAWLEKQGDSPIKWYKNTKDYKPQKYHSVLMKTTHGIAEGEWNGEHWIQYRWSCIIKDSDVIAWMVLSSLEKQGERKPADKVEPKFHEGDWVILTAGELSATLQIVNIDTNKKLYWFNDNSYLPIVDEGCLHLWTVQDAKDGDVLSDGTAIFIFKDLLSDGSVMSYCDYDTDSGESDAFCPLLVNLMCSKITPATKEQRDTLFAKIHEAGYIWDAKKKELKKIEQKSQRMISAEAKEAMYDKPTWSEDEVKINRIVACLENLNVADNDILLKDIDWLKSLKERIE